MAHVILTSSSTPWRNIFKDICYSTIWWVSLMVWNRSFIIICVCECVCVCWCVFACVRVCLRARMRAYFMTTQYELSKKKNTGTRYSKIGAPIDKLRWLFSLCSLISHFWFVKCRNGNKSVHKTRLFPLELVDMSLNMWCLEPLYRVSLPPVNILRKTK